MGQLAVIFGSHFMVISVNSVSLESVLDLHTSGSILLIEV